MNVILSALPLLVTAASIAIAVTMFIDNRRAALRNRISRLDEIAKILTIHYDAIDRLIDDPATPETLKEVAVRFSDGVNDYEVVQGIAKLYVQNPPKQRRRLPPWSEEIDKLQRSRKDLAQDFETVLASGIWLMLHRWPEASRPLQSLMLDLIKDHSREYAVAGTVVVRQQETKERRRTEPLVADGAVA